MSKTLSKMNLISVVQQLPKEDIETIQGYVEMIEKENQELKKQLEVGNKQYSDLVEEKEILQEQLSIKTLQLEELKSSKRDYTQENILEMKMFKLQTQQKVFIEYLEDLIKQNETVVEVSKYGLPKNCSKLLIDFYKEILQKYKEITQTKNDKSV